MSKIEQIENGIRVRIHGESEIFTLTKDQLPKIFDLIPLLKDFRKIVQQKGIQQAKIEFSQLLRKQLKTLIQEQVALPLSPRLLYEVVEDQDGNRHFIDSDYPISPNIVTRSEEIVKIFEQKLQLDPQNKVLLLFRDRFQLELAQIVTLVEVMSHDHLFANPILNNLAEEKKQVIAINGRKRNCLVSNWYGLVMPATEVHQGNKSYFNIYRIVFDIGKQNYYLETQGYLHGLSRKTQSKNLLNIDQIDSFTSLDEEKMMMRIIRLNNDKNHFDPESLLIKIGMQAGDWSLPIKIIMARKRQNKQLTDIEVSIQAILSIFEQEFDKDDIHQPERLEYFFEAIANPLIFGKKVFGKEIVTEFEKATSQGEKVNREKFLSSLLSFIPSLAWKAGGWSLCGGLSAGGYFTPGQAIHATHGFGGLPKFDSCLTCPSCGQLSTDGNCCSRCGYQRGSLHLSPSTFPSKKSDQQENKTSHYSKLSNSATSFFDWFSIRETVGVSDGLLGFKESVSVSQGLLAVA